MSSRAKVYTFLVIAVAILAGGGYLLQKKPSGGMAAQAETATNGAPPPAAKKAEGAPGEEKKEDATPIQVEEAHHGEIESSVASTANLRALRDVTIMARSEGVVKEVLVEEGAAVKLGQLLCQLDDRELRISLSLAEQRLEQTRAQLESAKELLEKNRTQIENKKTDLERNTQALEAGLVSETDVALLRHQLAELGHDERAQRAAVREAEYRVEELTAEIEQAKVQIAHAAVRAPFDGRIVERTVQLGQTVRGNDALFKLATFQPLYADVFLSESDSRRVRPGQPVEVRLGADLDHIVQGRVERISPVVDDATGTVKVTAELRPRDDAFRPGAFVRVRITTDTREQAVLIPKRAIIEEGGETYVFVENEGSAERREVQLGYQNGAVIEVISGVSAGEKVIVAGQGSLQDGSKTRVVG